MQADTYGISVLLRVQMGAISAVGLGPDLVELYTIHKAITLKHFKMEKKKKSGVTSEVWQSGKKYSITKLV